MDKLLFNENDSVIGAISVDENINIMLDERLSIKEVKKVLGKLNYYMEDFNIKIEDKNIRLIKINKHYHSLTGLI